LAGGDLMPITDAALYLPISIGTLDAILDEDEPLADAISGLSIAQVACLILIQCLWTTAGKRAPTAEQMLAQTIEIANTQAKQHGPDAFAAQALALLDRNKIRAGCELLCDHKIALLNDDDVAFRNYLDAYGNWNHTFCERYRAQLLQGQQRVHLPSGSRLLTPEQTKIFHGIKGHIDDPMHVQGYAGTGKSFLIKSVLMLLEDKRASTLVLAEDQRQLNALLIGTQGLEGMSARTYGQLILEMIPDDLTSPESLRMRRTNFPPGPTPDSELIRHLGIQPSRTFSPHQISKAVRETVRAFCYSDDKEIAKQHLPYDQAMFDDNTTRLVVLHLATELWKATLDPPIRDFQPRVHNYHRVKWAALNRRLEILPRYTHILVDECHDIAKPMLQILERSPQPTFTFGDEYQNLRGETRRRIVSLHYREVTHSVRAGTRIEGLVNSIIAVHPSETKPAFHGDPMTKTEVLSYTKVGIPEQPAAVLVSDHWGLFEWAQRLAREVTLEMLSDADDLKIFVNDCIELYRHGATPRHDELFQFSSWDALAKHYHNRRGFERIESLLRRGFSANDWLNTSAKFTKQRESGYALGLIKDVRNREFESVMLAPDVVDWAQDGKGVPRAEAASVVYVATTRVQRRLLVPERLGNLIPAVPLLSGLASARPIVWAQRQGGGDSRS
jgi:hypothetical protein